MPTYDFECGRCSWANELVVPMDDRDRQRCPTCNTKLTRNVSAPLVKTIGVPQGGGPDRFTADMLGIPLKELPSGLRTPAQPE